MTPQITKKYQGRSLLTMMVFPLPPEPCRKTMIVLSCTRAMSMVVKTSSSSQLACSRTRRSLSELNFSGIDTGQSNSWAWHPQLSKMNTQGFIPLDSRPHHQKCFLGYQNPGCPWMEGPREMAPKIFFLGIHQAHELAWMDPLGSTIQVDLIL